MQLVAGIVALILVYAFVIGMAISAIADGYWLLVVLVAMGVAVVTYGISRYLNRPTSEKRWEPSSLDWPARILYWATLSAFAWGLGIGALLLYSAATEHAPSRSDESVRVPDEKPITG